MKIIKNDACDMFIDLVRKSFAKKEREEGKGKHKGGEGNPIAPHVDELTSRQIPKKINQRSRCLEVVRISKYGWV